MRHLVVSWVLLCRIQYTAVQAQTAIWKFPSQGANLQPNVNDTVLLDWTSTFPSTILRMWCVNGTDGVTQDLASSFNVESTGPFNYMTWLGVIGGGRFHKNTAHLATPTPQSLLELFP